jgi:hypothetical protein
MTRQPPGPRPSAVRQCCSIFQPWRMDSAARSVAFALSAYFADCEYWYQLYHQLGTTVEGRLDGTLSGWRGCV